MAIAALPFGSTAQLWNVDFQGASGSMTGAGVVGSAGDYWTVAGSNPSATPVTISLNDNNNNAGNAIGLTYTGLASSGGLAADGTANPQALMDGFRSNINGGGGSSFAQMTYNLTGLLANTQYDLLAYAAATPGTDRGTLFFEALNGPILGQTTGSVVDIFAANAAGNAYTTFSLTSDATGAITFYSNFNSATSTQAPVNGFQIALVPEPSTLALAGLGLLSVLWRKQK